MRASVLLALMVSGAGALSITRRGVAARVGVAVTTGEFLRTRDARAAYDYNVESYGVGADRNAVDAPQPQQMVMPGSARAASPRAVAASRNPVPQSSTSTARRSPSTSSSRACTRPSRARSRRTAPTAPSATSTSSRTIFKANQKEFTVLPPGRMFIERINQRQSL